MVHARAAWHGEFVYQANKPAAATEKKAAVATEKKASAADRAQPATKFPGRREEDEKPQRAQPATKEPELRARPATAAPRGAQPAAPEECEEPEHRARTATPEEGEEQDHSVQPALPEGEEPEHRARPAAPGEEPEHCAQPATAVRSPCGGGGLPPVVLSDLFALLPVRLGLHRAGSRRAPAATATATCRSAERAAKGDIAKVVADSLRNTTCLKPSNGDT